MSVSNLRKTGEKYAKRYARLTMLSVAVAAVLTAVAGAASTPRRVAVLSGWVPIPPTVAVFVQFFGVCFAVGLVCRILLQNLETLRALFAEWIGEPLRARWMRLARRTQAVLFGVCCSIAGGAVVTAGVVYYSYRPTVVAATMVCIWPLATYWLLGRRPTAGSTDTNLSPVRTRYATLRHLETRTIAALGGFLLATAIGSGLWLFGVDSPWATVVGVVVWVVSTVVAYNRYASGLETRSDLRIVRYQSRGDDLELVVRNDGLEHVNLTRATITDTRTDRYHLTDSLRLSPASSATLCLPASFAVSPTDSERTLPLGYTLNRSQPTPVVYTRSGAAFELARTQSDDNDNHTFVEPTPEYTVSSTAVGASTHSYKQ